MAGRKREHGNRLICTNGMFATEDAPVTVDFECVKTFHNEKQSTDENMHLQERALLQAYAEDFSDAYESMDDEQESVSAACTKSVRQHTAAASILRADEGDAGVLRPLTLDKISRVLTSWPAAPAQGATLVVVTAAAQPSSTSATTSDADSTDSMSFPLLPARSCPSVFCG